MFEHKREMCRALSESAWSVLDYCHELESRGEMTRSEAQARALDEIGSMRYGPEMKGYFWITDMEPRLLMHPYREDLVDADLSEFADREGKRVFMDFVRLVEESGAGYVDYSWQWESDSGNTSRKTSYVKQFEPWGWILGTGICVDDVTGHITELIRQVVWICIVILAIVSALLIFLVFQSLLAEARRRKAEQGNEHFARRLQEVID